MFSTIDRSVVYPIGTDITEHDINIVSDLWTMAGRQVYRGARDPAYTHANVYWLYEQDDLDRVGLTEHKLDNNADMALLWYKDNPFGTLLQEEDWQEEETFWGKIPDNVHEQCLAEGWITPLTILERCLRSNMRLVTVDMLKNMPTVHSCEKCKKVSLVPFECAMSKGLDFPEKEKVFFIDERMICHTPPKGSTVWSLLGFTTPPEPSESSSEHPVAESVEQQPEESQPAA
jgi:hypothetical protein